MDEVEVHIPTLEVSNGLLKSILNVVTVSDPELADNEKILTFAEATLEDLLKGIAYSLLVTINRTGINGSESTLDGISEAFEGVILIEVESAETQSRDGVSVTKGAHGNISNFAALLLLAAGHHLLLFLGLNLRCHLENSEFLKLYN